MLYATIIIIVSIVVALPVVFTNLYNDGTDMIYMIDKKKLEIDEIKLNKEKEITFFAKLLELKNLYYLD